MCCFWRLFSGGSEKKSETYTDTGCKPDEVVKNFANIEHSDETLVSRLKIRLRKFAINLPAPQQDEMEEIIQGDVQNLDRRLKDVRRNFRNHLESPTHSLRKEWVDLIKNMGKEGEKGEKEAAQWVLQNFYEFLQGQIELPSPRDPDDNYGWRKHIQRDTLTKEAIMEVFSNFAEEKSAGILTEQVNNHDSSLVIIADGQMEMVPCNSQEAGLLQQHTASTLESSPRKANSHRVGLKRDSCPQPGDIISPLNTSASYIFNADGTKRERQYLAAKPLDSPKVLGDQNFAVRLGWEIDVVRLSTIPEVGGLPLLVLGHYIILQTGINNQLNLDMNRVDNWLRAVEESYLDNPYHNHLHGADVLCSMYHWFTSSFFRENMSSMELLASLMAAAAHDVGHDAVNNRFHVLTRSRLGTRYNDRSPLENYHACLAFELLYKPENNWVHGFEFADQSYLRSVIIELIIGTDMNYHKLHQDNVLNLINHVQLPKSPDDPPLRLRAKDSEKPDESRVSGEACEKLMILKVGLHIADISNPAKPNTICVYWAKKVIEEFFAQGDKEQARGLSISPLCNRQTSNLEEGQRGFINFVVMPIFKQWVKLMPEAQIAVTHLEKNLEFWTKRRNSGFLRKDLAKIQRERMSMESVKQISEKDVRSGVDKQSEQIVIINTNEGDS